MKGIVSSGCNIPRMKSNVGSVLRGVQGRLCRVLCGVGSGMSGNGSGLRIRQIRILSVMKSLVRHWIQIVKSIVRGLLPCLQSRRGGTMCAMQVLLCGIVRGVERSMSGIGSGVKGRVLSNLICHERRVSGVSGRMERVFRRLLCLVKRSVFYVVFLVKGIVCLIDAGMECGMIRILSCMEIAMFFILNGIERRGCSRLSRIKCGKGVCLIGVKGVMKRISGPVKGIVYDVLICVQRIVRRVKSRVSGVRLSMKRIVRSRLHRMENIVRRRRWRRHRRWRRYNRGSRVNNRIKNRIQTPSCRGSSPTRRISSRSRQNTSRIPTTWA